MNKKVLFTSLRAAHRWISFLAPAPHCWEHWVPMPCAAADWLVPLPPIAANTIIVPYVLRFAYDVPDAIPYLMATVGAGEVISCYILGMMLLFALNPFRKQLFQCENN